jgi:hypothetical protein
MFKSSFLTNLFGDTNVSCIFCKSSQTCDTKTQNDSYFGTEGVLYIFLSHLFICRCFSMVFLAAEHSHRRGNMVFS